MEIVMRILLMTGLLALAACDTTSSAYGGGSENNGYGKVKVGVPF